MIATDPSARIARRDLANLEQDVDAALGSQHSGSLLSGQRRSAHRRGVRVHHLDRIPLRHVSVDREDKTPLLVSRLGPAGTLPTDSRAPDTGAPSSVTVPVTG